MDDGIAFTPRSLVGVQYCAPPDVMRQIYEVECGLAKLDQQVFFFRYKQVLNDILASLDALASARIAGINAGFLDMYDEEQLLALSGLADGGAGLRLGDKDPLINKALAFKRCLMRIKDTITPGTPLSEEFLLGLYDELNGASETALGYRTTRLPDAISPEDGSVLYTPPEPEEIAGLMSDLVEFCNSSYSGAFVQTVMGHLRFEAITPFDYHMDHMGRLLCQSVFFRRGLSQHMICPIALLAAEQTDLHASILFPYRIRGEHFDGDIQSMVTRFIVFATQGVLQGIEVSRALMRYIQRLEEAWERRLGRVRPDSAHRAILNVLPATPEFNIPYIVLRTGRSRSAVNAALHDLERAGIVRRLGESQRNRSFEVPGATMLLKRLEDVLLSGNVPSREAASLIDTGIDSTLRV